VGNRAWKNASGDFAPDEKTTLEKWMTKTVRSLLGVLFTLAIALPAFSQQPVVSYPVHFDISPPMRDIIAPPLAGGTAPPALLAIPRAPQAPQFDPVRQNTPGPASNTTPGIGFDAQGVTCGCAPPDTNMAVGPNHIVQWVNLSWAVYDKLGSPVQAPKAGNSFWSGFGGDCQTHNNGDPIIQYDAVADRWLATQFAITIPFGPYSQCIAVSTTNDPTGTYARYQYSFPDVPNDLNDYPKFTVWPVVFDGAPRGAYFASYNMFLFARSFAGGRACAYDRDKMLSGAAATQVCFQGSSSVGSILPSDLDGKTVPANNTPNFYFDFGTNELLMWKFTPDFGTPANSSFVGPTHIPVAAFSQACGSCVPQSATSQTLDTLSDRLMYRNSYREFSDHKAVLINHSVTAGSSVGNRWYEIRDPNGTPTVFQSGTFAPDSTFRWMGSIASDKAGDIGLGYSASDSSIHPAIRHTGREPGDPLGTMQAEDTILNGTGSQTTGLSRWGDYSAMRIDPSDDCTFWYTTEYLKSDGTFNWSTWIGSFKFNSCGAPPPPAPAAPTDLVATPVSSSEIDLTWTDNSNNEDGFKIERCQGVDCTNFAQIAQTGPNVATYNDTGLSCNTSYTYRVRAFNAGGNSAYSNPASATTLNTPPAPPPILSLNPVSPTEIDLTWTPSTGQSSYDIYRCQGSNTCMPTTKIATVGPSATSYNDTGLTPNTIYGYQVHAVNGCGGDVPSNISYSMTPQPPPAAPSNLTATPSSRPTTPFVDLAWTDNSNNEDFFDIFRCNTGSGCTPNTLIATLPPNSTTYHDAGVVRKTTYRYQVFARNGSGSSGSNIATATTK
jgi:fibronectin type 3 domain-containing protein